ncbi:Hypothetical protein HVR_LOCUS570 [uncultured virus]|nr:Hypothetical protein HVR_LOCUS570 [uncultured virus]
MALNDYFVCVLVGCNRQTPTVLDLVPENQLTNFITRVNSGVLPPREDYIYDSNDVDFQVFNLGHTTYTTLLNACDGCTYNLFCIRKGKREIYDIVNHIQTKHVF